MYYCNHFLYSILTIFYFGENFQNYTKKLNIKASDVEQEFADKFAGDFFVSILLYVLLSVSVLSIFLVLYHGCLNQIIISLIKNDKIYIIVRHWIFYAYNGSFIYNAMFILAGFIIHCVASLFRFLCTKTMVNFHGLSANEKTSILLYDILVLSILLGSTTSPSNGFSFITLLLGYFFWIQPEENNIKEKIAKLFSIHPFFYGVLLLTLITSFFVHFHPITNYIALSLLICFVAGLAITMATTDYITEQISKCRKKERELFQISVSLLSDKYNHTIVLFDKDTSNIEYDKCTKK